MHVLFIEKVLRTDKLGILYLASVLQQDGHSVDLLQDDIDDIDNYFNSNTVDVVCWSMMSVESNWMFEKNKALKLKYKFISIIGGNHPTFFPEDGIKNEYVDFVVIGPGELVINRILRGEIVDKCIRGNIPDVNTTPMPFRDILYKYDEFGKSTMKRFIVGRNCYYNCTYCFNRAYKQIYKDQIKKLFSWRSATLVLDEIKAVKKTFGLELAYFNDDDIAANKIWLLSFCELIKKENIAWCGSIRAPSVDYDILKLMKESGCTFLNIAIESANPSTQKFIRREWNSNESVKSAIQHCTTLGIKTRLQNMIGFPIEDPLKDALDTLYFNQEVQPTDSWVAMFQPYRGTQLWQYSVDNGFLNADAQGGTFYEKTKLKIKNADKLNQLCKWWPYIIKYNIPLKLTEILIDIPLSDDIVDRLQTYRWEDGKKLLYGF